MKSFQWLWPCYCTQGQTTNMQYFMGFIIYQNHTGNSEAVVLNIKPHFRFSNLKSAVRNTALSTLQGLKSSIHFVILSQPHVYFMPFALQLIENVSMFNYLSCWKCHLLDALNNLEILHMETTSSLEHHCLYQIYTFDCRSLDRNVQ